MQHNAQGIVLHLLSEIPLLLFSLPPTSPNQFCSVTWTLLPSSPISLLLVVVIFYSPVFVKCFLSCLPICITSVRTLSVNFLFVTPSCLCRKSVCWIGCCLLLPHLLFSSNSWRRQDCNEETSSIMVARLQCWCISNLLWFGGATSLTMTMAAHQQSPMARMCSDLLNNCGKTAILARQHSPSIRQCNILDNGNGGALAIFLNSWRQ